MEITSFIVRRMLRDLLEVLKYPVWVLKGRPAPDSHVYKKNRIKRLSTKHGCTTFVETGTFYGQMINFSRTLFDVSVSIEIFEPFFQSNKRAFERDQGVKILLGDSAEMLAVAMKMARGPILFWLDGHYSGAGTGIGESVSPVIQELRLIAATGRKDHCIVIDDLRLFTGEGGYPTVGEAFEELVKINTNYLISLDRDSIIAEPASIC